LQWQAGVRQVHETTASPPRVPPGARSGCESLSASRIPADNCTTGIRFKHVHDAANHAVVTLGQKRLDLPPSLSQNGLLRIAPAPNQNRRESATDSANNNLLGFGLVKSVAANDVPRRVRATLAFGCIGQRARRVLLRALDGGFRLD
jgi:hypothetical protein